MFFFGALLVVAGIGVVCWMLFMLAVYALPFYAGLAAFFTAYHSGAGPLGGIIVGFVAAGATFGFGQLLLAFAPWTWLRLLTVLLFTAPSVVAGYAATLGIARMVMPSPIWQMIFSIVGAIAVGVTALVHITSMTLPGPTGQSVAQS
jgi:hypothetical protein